MALTRGKQDQQPATTTRTSVDTTEIIKRPPQLPKKSAEDDLPQFMQQGEGRPRGLEKASKEDFVIPRLAICQSMSPQRNKIKPQYIEGLQEGELFNTVTKEVYGSRAVLVTPLLFFRNRWKYTDDGSVDCFSPDSYTLGRLHPEGCRTCPHAQFTDGERPACNLFYNFPIIIHHMVDGSDRDPELAMISMKGAGLKYGREWNSLMRLRRHDAFGGLYVVEPVQETNNLGTYYVFKVRNAGIIRDEDLFKFAEGQYEVVSKEDLASNPDIVDRDPGVPSGPGEEM